MFGLSAAATSAIVGLGGAAIGAYSSNKASKKAAAAQKQNTQMSIDAQKEATKLDPRIDPLIYGEKGIVNNISGLLSQPQSTGTQQFNNEINTFMKDYGRPLFDDTVRSASSLMSDRVVSPRINTPSSNNYDSSGLYSQFINNKPGENPYLTGAIQKGINQGMNSFQNLQSDATRNMLEGILPNIRGGAISSGQFGGSRQGITESKALNDFSTQMGRAVTQVGQGAIDSAIGAQAGAYNDDTNRALNATGNLSGQQYGAASQNAQMKEQQELQNAQLQGQTNQLNAQTNIAGAGLQSGLINQAYGYQNAADNAQINKVGQVSGLLQPYAGKGSPISVPQQQPIYNNSLSSAIGGATAGLGLYNAFQAPQQNQFSGGYGLDSQIQQPSQYNYGSTPNNYFSYTPKDRVA